GVLHGTRVGDDGDETILQQGADDRIQVGDSIDLTGAHGGDGTRAAANPDEGHIARFDTILRQEEADGHVGRRTRSRDTNLLALEIFRAFVVRHRLFGHRQHNHRGEPLLDEGRILLPLGLQGNGVLEGARYDVSTTPDHRLQRAGTACKVKNLDIQAFVLEVAVGISNGQWEVINQSLPTDGNADVLLLELLCTRHDGQHAGCTRHASSFKNSSPRYRHNEIGRA